MSLICPPISGGYGSAPGRRKLKTLLAGRLLTAGLFVSLAFAGNPVQGDARRGEQLFRGQQCVECHSINGHGGTSAPDLGRRIDRNFTPTVMAALMWNHAPAMWDAIRKQNITVPRLAPDQAADLFAYFMSARYFERPGDAARGKLAFESKRCAECHGITQSKAAGAPPVAQWDSLADPVVLAAQMWNHGARMKAAFAERKITRPEVTGQDLTDMLVYLQNLPATRALASNFHFSESNEGAQLFTSKGCAGCHNGKMALENLLRNQTLTEIAADMWNHQPLMKQPPPQLAPDEMRQIIGFIWARQYFRGSGNSASGKKVFAAKRCAECHNNASSGAPVLAKGKSAYSDITMVSVLWEHGPAMHDRMSRQNITWPRFTTPQMADLIAYLNSL